MNEVSDAGRLFYGPFYKKFEKTFAAMAHILVTGVGGYLLTNDDNCAIISRSLANHGRDSIYLSIDDDKNLNDEELSMVVGRRFKFERMGYKLEREYGSEN